MQSELQPASHYTAAAKDLVQKDLSIHPFPAQLSGDYDTNIGLYTPRFRLLGLMQDLSHTTELKSLNDIARLRKVEEEGLASPMTRALLETLVLATANPDRTGLEFPPTTIDTIVQTYPQLLSSFALGEYLIAQIQPAYRDTLAPPQDDGSLNQRYQHLAGEMDRLIQTQTLTDPSSRQKATLDILSLLTVISHPKGLNDIEVPNPDRGGRKEKLSTIATRLLVKFQLGEEMGRLMGGEGEVKQPAETSQPAPEMDAFSALVVKAGLNTNVEYSLRKGLTERLKGNQKGSLAYIKDTLAKFSSPPLVPDTIDNLAEEMYITFFPRPELKTLCDTIGEGSAVKLDLQYIAQFQEGLGTPESAQTRVRSERKGYSLPGASHIEKFTQNFIQPVATTLEKPLQSKENIAKAQAAYARIELLMINALPEPLQMQILQSLSKPPHHAYTPEDRKEALKRYAEKLLDTNQVPRQPFNLEMIDHPAFIRTILEHTMNALLETYMYIPQGMRRNFGIAECLKKQYTGTQDELLRFIMTMNELATNPKTREKLGFDQIF